ncbi:MAG: sugar ABC transporter ATP-binding protein [Cyanobacteria bacterium J06559_3]
MLPLLEMQEISKYFHGVAALEQVSLHVFAGEVHALMGENGAGKSTLMKILAGAYIADEGTIYLEGRPLQVRNPNDARQAGISLIYQELNVAPNLTVAENIFLGQEHTRAGGLLDTTWMYQQTHELLQRLHASFAADTPTAQLSIAEQQQVEIARALKDNSRILVMDEPTAALSDRETEQLFAIINRLRDNHIAIIYISHRMEEIYALADRVSVLRDGQCVGSLTRDKLAAERLVRMMVGRPLQDFYEHKTHPPIPQGFPPLLEITDLTNGNGIGPASLELYPGEILSLAGLVGAGRTELARLIFGADPKADGELYLNQQPLSITAPEAAIAAGIGYVPEDRKDQGLFLDMSSQFNIVMNVLDSNATGGILRLKALQQVAANAIASLKIRLASPVLKAGALSGGNQQKLLLARWLAINPRVLILDEPTRGVDIGAKGEIYRIISDLAAQGIGILMISSDLPEVIGMSDRVLVMRSGKIVGEVGGQTSEAITQENIMAYATGIKYQPNHSGWHSQQAQP